MKHAQNLNVHSDDKGKRGRTTPSMANKSTRGKRGLSVNLKKILGEHFCNKEREEFLKEATKYRNHCLRILIYSVH